MTSTPSLARAERWALADSFERTGPDAPTALPGWDAEALLEHLLIREGAMIAHAVQRLPIRALRDCGRAVEQEVLSGSWSTRIERFRSGPPRTSPLRPADSWINGIEHLVHHEDLLRAQPEAPLRELPPALDAEIMRRLQVLARGIVRVPATVTLISPDASIRIRSRRDQGTVRVHGSPTELALWSFGRDTARVRTETDEAGARALVNGTRGG